MILTLLTSALAGSGPIDTLDRFVAAGDRQDATKLGAVLHKDFRVVAQMPDGLSIMSRALYLDLISSKKIGGTPRKASYTVVMNQDDLATVRGTLDSKEAHFDCTWTLAREGGTWLVLQDAVVFEPRS